MGEIWEIITTVALFGAAQIGLLIFVLGDMRSTQKSHGERLEKVEDKVSNLATDVAMMKGEWGP